MQTSQMTDWRIMKKRRYNYFLFFSVIFIILAVLFSTSSQTEAIAATKVTINHTNLVLVTGQTKMLKISGAKSKVLWKSSKKSVANVSTTGKVTAKKAGKATITATTGGKKYKCTVSVENPSLNAEEITLIIGDTYDLKLNNTAQKVKWLSKNQMVAAVSATGKVTARQAGKTIIVANVAGKKYECTILVKTKEIPVTELSLNMNSVSIKVGQTQTIIAYVQPQNATLKKVVWNSSNINVVTVANGLIKGLAPGIATVSVTCGGKTALCTVSVVADSPVIEKKLYINPSFITLDKGKTYKAYAYVEPRDGSSANTITWTSFNPNIATVDSDGTITGISKGSTAITAKCGTLSANMTVIVNEKTNIAINEYISVTNITMDKEGATVKIGDTLDFYMDATFVNNPQNFVLWFRSVEGVNFTKSAISTYSEKTENGKYKLSLSIDNSMFPGKWIADWYYVSDQYNAFVQANSLDASHLYFYIDN